MTSYSGEDVFKQLAPPTNWVKRVAISTVLLGSLLGTGLAEATSVGASALTLQDKNYKALQMATDADTQEMEKSITATTALQDSLSSLAEAL